MAVNGVYVVLGEANTVIALLNKARRFVDWICIRSFKYVPHGSVPFRLVMKLLLRPSFRIL